MNLNILHESGIYKHIKILDELRYYYEIAVYPHNLVISEDLKNFNFYTLQNDPLEYFDAEEVDFEKWHLQHTLSPQDHKPYIYSTELLKITYLL